MPWNVENQKWLLDSACVLIHTLPQLFFNPLRRTQRSRGVTINVQPSFWHLLWISTNKTPKSSTKRKSLHFEKSSTIVCRGNEENMRLARSPTSHCNLYNLCLVSETRISVRLAGVSVSFVGRCALWDKKGEPSGSLTLFYILSPFTRILKLSTKW